MENKIQGLPGSKKNAEVDAPAVKRLAVGDVFFAGDFKFTLKHYWSSRDVWDLSKECRADESLSLPGVKLDPVPAYTVSLTAGEIADLKDREAARLSKDINADIPADPAPPAPKVYERAKDTAVKIRKALKKEFPATKFSVTSEEYAGGSSVRVAYVDGPPLRRVQQVAGHFQGAEFDGMVDLKSYPGYTDKETGERCSGADWVNVHRSYTKATALHACRMVIAQAGRDDVINEIDDAKAITDSYSGHSFFILALDYLSKEPLGAYSGKITDAWENDQLAH